MSTPPILLILGAGPNIGASLSRSFASKGYKIATTSRRGGLEESNTNSADHLSIKADLSDPSSVAGVFEKVKQKWGVPSVVVYNAAAVSPNKAEDPASLPLDKFTQDLHINTTSVFAAAQEAVKGFAQLQSSASKTFIYTGNCMNQGMVIGPIMTLGVGKSATAHMVANMAGGYKEKGYKFYYADERQENGDPMYNAIGGEAAAEYYLKLAESKEQGPWSQTFVNGIGYKDFSGGKL